MSAKGSVGEVWTRAAKGKFAMVWDYNVALQRIENLIGSCPQITMEGLASGPYQRLVEARLAERAPTPFAREALISIPRDRAILVDAVHVYARLSNYDEYRLEDGAETLRAHKRALGFLHLQYGAMDRIVEDFGAQRVDFHGSRLHCVVVDPLEDERARIVTALVLAQRLIDFTRLASREFAGADFEPKLKIGIDTGKCVAINSGSGCEQEPLFLGQPANYAAKLADGDGEGIRISNRVRQVLGLATLRDLSDERHFPLSPASLIEIRQRAYEGAYDIGDEFADEARQYERLLAGWRTDIREQRAATGGEGAFQFHSHTPPLRTIEFGELSPGNSIRMPLASIFSDLHGYTAYIDKCMNSGRSAEAVRALHVLRGEFHNVLKQDFRSRKVRYIGDCMHGLLACGTALNVDLRETTREAVKCAGALQSSFELVQSRLGGINDLGLATGIEVGETPISRIGIRGDRSVRVASSTATIQSQIEQEGIEGSGLALGPNAYEQLSFSARRHFPNRRQESPDYESLVLILATVAAVATSTTDAHAAEPEFRPHAKG